MRILDDINAAKRAHLAETGNFAADDNVEILFVSLHYNTHN